MIRIDNVSVQNYGFRVLRDGTEPEAPQTRDRVVTIPGRDGAYDFGADLEPRVFPIALRLPMQTDYRTFKKKMRQLKRLIFTEYGKPKNVILEWDLNPGTFYIARYSGSLDGDRIWTSGNIELPMTAFNPTAYQTIAAANMDAEEPNPESVDWDASGLEVTMHNYGDKVIPLDLTITGVCSAPVIRNLTTGESLVIDRILSATDVLAIDGKKGYVTLNGVNINNFATGTFPKMPLFENTLKFECTGTPAAVIDFTFNFQLN